MKIAITFTDASHAFHAGGEVQRHTFVHEIKPADLPAALYVLLERSNNPKDFVSVSTSIVEE